MARRCARRNARFVLRRRTVSSRFSWSTAASPPCRSCWPREAGRGRLRFPVFPGCPWHTLPGLVYATGHFRNGVLLAPLTGRVVADLVLENREDEVLRTTSPQRFGEY